MFKIHGLCLIKNEADIIGQGLRAALCWCDHIYVFDNGSTDGTWERVKSLARRHPAIVPYRCDDAPFRDGLRSEIYHAFVDRARPKDWWARVDADEFYVDDPRAFLGKVPAKHAVVWNASLSYYFTTEDAKRYRASPAAYGDDVPVEEKCRYYYNHWSEIRFVRHSAMEPWRTGGPEGWPEGLTARVRSHPARIVAKHFPYRSPQQIERRIQTRAASALAGKVFTHEAIVNWSQTVDPMAIQQHHWANVACATESNQMEWTWESRVLDAAHLEYDAHDGRYALNEHLMPAIPALAARRTLVQRIRGRVARLVSEFRAARS